ncbi:MAG TPA: hypothetical protein VJI12_02930 [archaeon]|nr:hypothetical protein [archaeon]
MRTARTDWKRHEAEDFSLFGSESMLLGKFLAAQFKDTLYYVCMAHDYSDGIHTAEDTGPGDRRFLAWYEIAQNKERIAYLRLHADGHIEGSRCSDEFTEAFDAALKEYTGGRSWLEND